MDLHPIRDRGIDRTRNAIEPPVLLAVLTGFVTVACPVTVMKLSLLTFAFHLLRIATIRSDR